MLIKRSHPERMTSLVHTHTLLPCPPLCPHSHAEPRQGRQVEVPSGKGMSICVCQQAKCRLRAFLTFFPLVHFAVAAFPRLSLPAELDQQKPTLYGKGAGVSQGLPSSSTAVEKSPWLDLSPTGHSPPPWLHYSCVRFSPVLRNSFCSLNSFQSGNHKPS